MEEARVELNYLEKKEDTLQKRLEALKDILKSVDNNIDSQRKIIAEAEEGINLKVKDSSKIQKDMRYRAEKEIGPLLKAANDNEEKIMSVLNSILVKIMDKNRVIEKYKLESVQAADELEEFFDKRGRTEQLIASLGKEKLELEEAMKNLILKAKSFNLSVKSSDVKDYVNELQSSLNVIETKRSGFINKIGELTELISRK
jgi:hypothetical protein